MNQNNQNQGNNKSSNLPGTENMVDAVDFDEDDYGSYEEDYDPYEDDLPPYPAGEAYQAYCEDPTYDNAIEAAEEIWGIPDPRLIGLD